ncbi:hypothetical protein B0H15DRAFT_838493 [Mycena belliarum]|uniref:Secreted protein n=1 Tax=Mycena belliarum TaxID=1033014 RepID=A0AAD6U4L6_9AGAR|nr:hypothetical protein B0H15DRAFT_838493 [Mycena belliae]
MIPRRWCAHACFVLCMQLSPPVPNGDSASIACVCRARAGVRCREGQVPSRCRRVTREFTEAWHPPTAHAPGSCLDLAHVPLEPPPRQAVICASQRPRRDAQRHRGLAHRPRTSPETA